MSNKRKMKPVSVPKIGQQQPFDISDAVPRQCAQCGKAIFDQVLRLGLISALSPKNRTGQDVLVKFEVFLCRECGHEYGQEVPMKKEY